MRKLIIALVLLIMITATAIAALRWLRIGPFEGTETADSASSRPVAVAEPQAYFVPLDPVLIPLLKGDKVVSTLQIQMKLEVVGDINRDSTVKGRPRVANAFFQELYGFVPRMLQTSERLDIIALKQRLLTVCDRTLGKGIVRDVLVQSVNEVPAS